MSRTAKHSTPPLLVRERERRKRPNVESCSSRAYNVGMRRKKHIALQTRLAIHEWAPTAKCQTCLPLLCKYLSAQNMMRPKFVRSSFRRNKKHPGMNLLSSVHPKTLPCTVRPGGRQPRRQQHSSTTPCSVLQKGSLSIAITGFAQGLPNQRSQVTFLSTHFVIFYLS